MKTRSNKDEKKETKPDKKSKSSASKLFIATQWLLGGQPPKQEDPARGPLKKRKNISKVRP